MSKERLIFYGLVLAAIVIIAVSICLVIAKKISRPAHKVNGILITIAILICYFCLLNYAFSREGILYDAVEWEQGAYKNDIYYTEAGEKFYIQDDYLISESDAAETHKLSDAYLNIKSFLVFDEKHIFEQIEDSQVYVSEEYGHVYPLQACSWNIFGSFVAPEKSGIVVRGIYIIPFSLCEEYSNIHKQILATIGLFGMLAPVLVITFKIIYLCLMKGGVELKKDYEYYSKIFVFPCAFAVALITDIANSFLEFLIIETLFLAFVFWVIPFVQRSAEIEYNETGKGKCYPRGMLLKNMLEEADWQEVASWRKSYAVILAIYVTVWIAISVISSMW